MPRDEDQGAGSGGLSESSDRVAGLDVDPAEIRSGARAGEPTGASSASAASSHAVENSTPQQDSDVVAPEVNLSDAEVEEEHRFDVAPGPGEELYREGYGDRFDGWVFRATLNFTVPLDVLRRHGEVFRGPKELAPRYAKNGNEGIWMPHDLDSWEGSCASSIGPVKPSKFVPFLIAFREVLESDLDDDEKLRRLIALRDHSEAFAEIWDRCDRHEVRFPYYHVFERLTVISRVGDKTAEKLHAAGFERIAELAAVEPADLRERTGLGKATCERIVEATQAHMQRPD